MYEKGYTVMWLDVYYDSLTHKCIMWLIAAGFLVYNLLNATNHKLIVNQVPTHS